LNAFTKKVDVSPMVKYYMDQLGIYDLFSKYGKKPGRCTVDPAQILSVMVANMVCTSQFSHSNGQQTWNIPLWSLPVSFGQYVL